MKRKWEIEKLKDPKQLKKTANIVLNNRIESLVISINKYFDVLSVESLHDIRIALRRVRYSMELFIVCYNKKIFLKFYNKIQSLQDSSGSVRDVDISLENINSLVADNQIKIDSEIITKAVEKKTLLEDNFRLELKKFILNKSFNDFLKQIS
ncbi:MAG: CHAD domain-containing protein [Ignavibacteriota bacterium]